MDTWTKTRGPYPGGDYFDPYPNCLTRALQSWTLLASCQHQQPEAPAAKLGAAWVGTAQSTLGQVQATVQPIPVHEPLQDSLLQIDMEPQNTKFQKNLLWDFAGSLIFPGQCERSQTKTAKPSRPIGGRADPNGKGWASRRRGARASSPESAA